MLGHVVRADDLSAVSKGLKMQIKAARQAVFDLAGAIKIYDRFAASAR